MTLPSAPQVDCTRQVWYFFSQTFLRLLARANIATCADGRGHTFDYIKEELSELTFAADVALYHCASLAVKGATDTKSLKGLDVSLVALEDGGVRWIGAEKWCVFETCTSEVKKGPPCTPHTNMYVYAGILNIYIYTHIRRLYLHVCMLCLWTWLQPNVPINRGSHWHGYHVK